VHEDISSVQLHCLDTVFVQYLLKAKHQHKMLVHFYELFEEVYYQV
jgi:hypothetical protein